MMIKLIIKDDDDAVAIAVVVAFAADNNDDDDDANDNAGCVAPPPAAPLLVPGLAWPGRLASAGLGLRAVGGCTTMPNSLIDRIGWLARKGRGNWGVGNELCHSLNVAHM